MKVTDEMVFKARSAHQDDEGIVYSTQRAMRRALEAALTEPEEIPVSPAMAKAGIATFGDWGLSTPFGDEWRFVEKVYRAMERQRRKETLKPPAHSHKRSGDILDTLHRRKDDP